MIYNCLVIQNKRDEQVFFNIESDSEIHACESAYMQELLSCGDVVIVNYDNYFICLAIGWMPVSKKVCDFWMEHERQDRKNHPLIWTKDPVATLMNIANMEEGFLFRK